MRKIIAGNGIPKKPIIIKAVDVFPGRFPPVCTSGPLGGEEIIGRSKNLFLTMHCRRCKIKMREIKRAFHKQRKWICPRCGKVRFQKVKKVKSE